MVVLCLHLAQDILGCQPVPVVTYQHKMKPVVTEKAGIYSRTIFQIMRKVIALFLNHGLIDMHNNFYIMRWFTVNI